MITTMVESPSPSPSPPQKIGTEYAFSHIYIIYTQQSAPITINNWNKQLAYIIKWLNIFITLWSQIVMMLVMRGANCLRGQTYARGHVELVVLVVIVFLQALLETMMCVPAMPIWLHMVADTNALKVINFFA